MFYFYIRISRQFVTKKSDFFLLCKKYVRIITISCISCCFLYSCLALFFDIIMTFVIVDLETTGLSPYKHSITEIAAVRFNWTTVIDSFQTLVNPERHIPTFITRLTGISNEMVENAPIIKDILPEFISFLGEDIFVAHNISFDLWFLNHARYHHFESYFPNSTLCTRKLARQLVPEVPKRNLGFLCEYFGITNTRAHRALSDVHATTELLKNYLRIAEEKEIDIKSFLG